MQRGPYDIISVMNESVNDKPYVLNGKVIDLFDPELPVLSRKSVELGRQAFLYILSRIKDRKRPQVLASASRIYKEKVGLKAYSFVSKSPKNTTNSMRILLPDQPLKITLTDPNRQALPMIKSSWDASSHTSYISFENDPEGTTVNVTW